MLYCVHYCKCNVRLYNIQLCSASFHLYYIGMEPAFLSGIRPDINFIIYRISGRVSEVLHALRKEEVRRTYDEAR